MGLHHATVGKVASLTAECDVQRTAQFAVYRQKSILIPLRIAAFYTCLAGAMLCIDSVAGESSQKSGKASVKTESLAEIHITSINFPCLLHNGYLCGDFTHITL